MTRRIKTYMAIIMALGLFLAVTALWFIINPQTAVNLPDEDPFVYLEVNETDKGTSDRIEVFPDGTIYYLEEQFFGIRQTDISPVRIWKKGTVPENDLDSLINCIRTDEFSEIATCYTFCSEDDDATAGYETNTVYGMSIILHVNCDWICKTITASGNITPAEGMTHPDIPLSLNHLYNMLMVYGATMTEEIHRETVDL